jgi:hypothetical protein
LHYIIRNMVMNSENNLKERKHAREKEFLLKSIKWEYMNKGETVYRVYEQPIKTIVASLLLFDFLH